ncbi:UDP-N-acetylglucosamine 2-epimerase [Halanaeroarchaeum sp. HSR-CO]|uniref:UDP-N-acetylglucosamine 2-epimerase n=1 Tax=Halanaeroarchaeum sp. HSR-CO TaxID=2866382 RepID=UPI00217DCA32|nr:UDP-N-acetylglucosamine 2-epimerase [Halanaeroarchaeum sp. HSR-CO]UWG48114.1 UDP-N-acetylglucosamine 2-epimerase [Halanaeroarchaeum sp. HSR-CO]
MKEIAILTGTRAEYGLLKETMNQIDAAGHLHLKIVVTGMHLVPRFGNTVAEITSDGFDIDERVHMLLEGDSGISTAKSIGTGITGISQALDSLEPEALLVLGDRIEALAGGVSAATMNIPVVHIAGGSVRGGGMIDESIRHALTRFAHIHLVQSESDKRVLEQVGEDPKRIHLVGAPALDQISAGEFSDGDEVINRLDLDPSEKLILVIQHPITTKPELAGEQIESTIRAVEQSGEQAVIIHPNSDPGRDRMVSHIKQVCERNEKIVETENLPREDYLGLLHVADLLVGNSSSGIIEAPCFELPTIDVGTRQGNRERAVTISRVSHKQDEIKKEIQRRLAEDHPKRTVDCKKSPYYHGGVAERIVDILVTTTFDRDLLDKSLKLQSI